MRSALVCVGLHMRCSTYALCNLATRQDYQQLGADLLQMYGCCLPAAWFVRMDPLEAEAAQLRRYHVPGPAAARVLRHVASPCTHSCRIHNILQHNMCTAGAHLYNPSMARSHTAAAPTTKLCSA
jgi:hypothetical protein